MRIRFCWACLVAALSLTACVGAPDDVAQLNAGSQLERASDHGLVDANVALAGAALVRGPNDFEITLRAVGSDVAPVLTAVDASMAAHGHRASAAGIARDGAAFRIEALDLFMSGRWQIALGVEVDGRSDLVEFALDVP